MSIILLCYHDLSGCPGESQIQGHIYQFLPLSSFIKNKFKKSHVAKMQATMSKFKLNSWFSKLLLEGGKKCKHKVSARLWKGPICDG